MNSLKTNIIKVSIVFATLPITILVASHEQAKAEDPKGLYLTGSYGSSAINTADWKATISDIDYKGKLKFRSGSGWETGLGYDFGRLRTELTYGQTSNDIKNMTAQINEGTNIGASVDSHASGDLKITNIFFNSYLDFPIGTEKRFTPYIGGGIGGSKLEVDDIKVVNEEVKAANAWLFGYQVKVGLSFSITQNLNIFGEGTSSSFSDLGVAGDKYGLASDSDFSYRGGFRLNF